MAEIFKTDVFDRWFDDLKDERLRKRILARIRLAGAGNLGDVKPVGQGVSEMRIHYGAGCRVYFTQKGRDILILLAGGDKSTQDKDIKRAIGLAQNLQEDAK